MLFLLLVVVVASNAPVVVVVHVVPAVGPFSCNSTAKKKNVYCCPTHLQTLFPICKDNRFNLNE